MPRMKVYTAVAVLAGVGAAGCGKKKSSTDSTTTASIPSLNFTVPSSTLSLRGANLTSAAETNVLTEWGTRINNTITNLNKTIARLNSSSSLQKSGTVSYTSSAGMKVNVTLADLTDPVYAESATICISGQPRLFIKWSSDNTHVMAIRDFSIDAFGGTTTPMITQITYVGGTPAMVTENTYGVPWNVPTDVASNTTHGGTYLGEYISASSVSGGVFTMSGVNAWEQTARTSANASNGFTGDAWLTGQLAADGSGNFEAWRIYNPICSGTTFSESSTTSPGWCYLGTVAAGGGTPTYTIGEGSQWTSSTLQPIGIASDSNINVVTFPAAVTCPSS